MVRRGLILSLLCFFPLNLFASQQIEFIPMPDRVNSTLIKSIYENTNFNINNNKNNGYYLEKEKVIGNTLNKDVWLGSPIRHKESHSNNFTLSFKPNEFRKIGDVFLEPFEIDFKLLGDNLSIFHSSAKALDVKFDKESKKLWIMTRNKSDILVLVPSQRTKFRTVGFMVCPRVYESKYFKSELNLIDSGYVIDAAKFKFSGETKASFTTGSYHSGKNELRIYTSDFVSAPEISYDVSRGRDPNTSLNYIPIKNEFIDVKDDENIIGGLKFFYNMSYESGKRRISDFSNYVWVRKNQIDLPLRLKKSINGSPVFINVSPGTCYSIVMNAKVFENTYLDDNLVDN